MPTIEVTDCNNCCVRRLNRSTFCPFLKNEHGTNITVIYLGRKPELHSDCPLKKYDKRKYNQTTKKI